MELATAPHHSAQRPDTKLVAGLEQFAEQKAQDGCEFVGERALLYVCTGFAVEVPPVAVLTDACGLLVAEAVEAMKVPKVRSVEELADAPQHDQEVVRF